MAFPMEPSELGDHVPGQRCYLLGTETGSNRQQEDRSVPYRIASLIEVAKDGVDLTLRQSLGLLAE